MAVLGFNYTKLSGERTGSVKGQVNISSNVNILNVEETNLSFDKTKKSLNITFRYVSTYNPDIARIDIEGNLVYVNDAKKTDDLLKEWKKNKTLPRDVMTEVINYILTKCNVDAIILSRDLNIPSPIPLPKVGEGAAAPAKPKAKKKAKKK